MLICREIAQGREKINTIGSPSSPLFSSLQNNGSKSFVSIPETFCIDEREMFLTSIVRHPAQLLRNSLYGEHLDLFRRGQKSISLCDMIC